MFISGQPTVPSTLCKHLVIGAGASGTRTKETLTVCLQNVKEASFGATIASVQELSLASKGVTDIGELKGASALKVTLFICPFAPHDILLPSSSAGIFSLLHSAPLPIMGMT